MFGSNKIKTLERENIALRREVATHEETIEALQAEIQAMQADHRQELTTIQARHVTETANMKKQHEKEISLLKTTLSKAVTWFPYFREMLRMESVCRTAGSDDEQTVTLIKGKPLEYSGELYSEEHNCKFAVEQVTAQITSDPTNKRELQLNIDKVPFGMWCKRQKEKLKYEVKSRSKFGL